MLKNYRISIAGVAADWIGLQIGAGQVEFRFCQSRTAWRQLCIKAECDSGAHDSRAGPRGMGSHGEEGIGRNNTIPK